MTLRDDVLRYVHDTYKTKPEFLWRRFPHYAVLRHADNRKWYGLIMDVPREKLGLQGKERVDILNVKLSDPTYADVLIRQEGYFKGYHISRGNWISVLLDGTIAMKEIQSLIDESFIVTSKRRKKTWKLNRVDHIAITVRNIDTSVDFYTRILGMEHEVGAGGRHALRFGQQKINLHSYKGEFQPAAKNPEYGSQDLCFIIDGAIESVKEEIASKGIEIIEGIVDRHGALGPMKSLYLRDPDGNLIELAEYGKKKK